MISIETKINLFDSYFLGEKINNKLLLKCGFSKEDINEWINQEILLPKPKTLFSKEEYDINTSEIIFTIQTLYSLRKNDKADSYIKILHNRGIKEEYIILRLILIELTNKNYKIWDLIKELSQIDNGKFLTDANFYLLLLNHLTNLPEELQEYIRDFTFNDIKANINNNDYNELALINKVRSLCLKQKFTLAFTKFKTYTEENDNHEISTRITRSLIFHINVLKNEFNNKLLKLVKDKNYSKVISILNSENKKRPLRDFESQIINLCKIITETNETNKLPYTSHVNIGNTFYAIDRCDYKTALICAKHTIEQYNQTSKVIYYLLEDINNLIKAIKELNNRIINILNEHFNGNDTILDEYLNEIKAKEYKELIIRLLIISNAKKEINYDTVLPILVGLSRNKFNFNFKEFITLYEKAKENKDDYLAKSYYYVLIEANRLNTNIENKTIIDEYLKEQTFKPTTDKKQLQIKSIKDNN